MFLFVYFISFSIEGFETGSILQLFSSTNCNNSIQGVTFKHLVVKQFFHEIIFVGIGFNKTLTTHSDSGILIIGICYFKIFFVDFTKLITLAFTIQPCEIMLIQSVHKEYSKVKAYLILFFPC